MTPTEIPPTPGSGVNAAHVNEPEASQDGSEKDNPADFFGDGPDGGEHEEVSLMPEDEEHPEHPGEDGPSDGEASAPIPASGTAQPGQQLSEDGQSQREVGADGALAPPGKPAEDLEQAAQLAADAAAREQAASEQAEKEASEQAEKDASEKDAAGASADLKGDDGSGESKGHNGPRGYVVVREVELTKDYLEHFLKEIEEGKKARTFYMVLEPKIEARAPGPVLKTAFKKHTGRLGKTLRLGAIPLSTWNIRTVGMKPKVIDDNIEIE